MPEQKEAMPGTLMPTVEQEIGDQPSPMFVDSPTRRSSTQSVSPTPKRASREMFVKDLKSFAKKLAAKKQIGKSTSMGSIQLQMSGLSFKCSPEDPMDIDDNTKAPDSRGRRQSITLPRDRGRRDQRPTFSHSQSPHRNLSPLHIIGWRGWAEFTRDYILPVEAD